MTGSERQLREGALAILPTDTVYGIGCAAGLEEACARLYAVKDRPSDQPTAVVFGSVERDAQKGTIAEGGSTITQQYVRTVLLGRERTVHRKLREAVLALQL